MSKNIIIAASDVIIAENLTAVRRVRLARIAEGLSQLDLASITGLNPSDITNIELDRSVYPWKLKRVLEALELGRQP